MKNEYIIDSLLDTDLYKLTMQQGVLLGNLQDVKATHRFQCRTEGVDLRQFLNEIREEVDHLCQLRFTNDEIEYLRTLPFMEESYLEYIGHERFKLNRDNINIREDKQKGGHISITVEGNWFHTILFETPLLAIVSEVFTRNKFSDLHADDHSSGFKRLQKKIDLMNDLGNKVVRDGKEMEVQPFSFVDFGTRRRFSKDWQKLVLSTLKKKVPEEIFVGTSNVMYAKELGLKPIGTQAHEWVEAGQGLKNVSLRESQNYMLELWEKVYRGQLGIALTDTITTEVFLNDFDLYMAKIYDGVRQDSGNPKQIGDMVIERYKELGIDPTTKTLICSDGLDWPTAIDLWRYFAGRISISFGIGTNLLNDFEEDTSFQIVLKMVRCNDKPVAKISDSRGKTIAGKQSHIARLKKVFNLDF